MRTSNLLSSSLLVPMFLAAAGCAISSSDPPVQSTAEAIVNEDDVAIGKGYDTLRDRVVGECVTYDSIEQPFTGQIVDNHLDIVQSSRELMKKLDVSVGASASYGILSGSAKVNYSESTSVTEDSVFAVISVVVRNGANRAVHPRLTADAAALLRADAGRFRERCGDQWVSSIEAGGVYYAVLQIDTSSREEKADVSVAVSASAFGFGSVDVGVKNQLHETLKNKQIHVWSYQQGGLATEATACQDLDCVLKRAFDFPSIVSRSPRFASAEEGLYTDLALPDDKKTMIDVLTQRQVEGELSGDVHDTSDYVANISAALAAPNDYLPFDANGLAQAKTKAQANLNVLRQSLRDCWTDYTKCILPSVTTVTTALPERLPRVNQMLDEGFERETTRVLSSPWFASDPAQGKSIGPGADLAMGYAHSGANNGFVFAGSGSSGWGALNQYVNVKPNTKYVASGWFRTSDAFDGGYVSVRSDASSGFAVLNELPISAPIQGSYAYRSFEFDSGPSSRVLFYAGFFANGSTKWIQVDDVSIREKGQ